MAKRNFNGSQINQSVTIAEQAGAAIDDVRNLILKYDENGDVVVATDGTAPIVGIAIIEAGYNDISGAESGKVAKGDQVDVQIKDIGYILAGGAIKKGEEVTATAGKATKAADGDYVIGVRSAMQLRMTMLEFRFPSIRRMPQNKEGGNGK